MQVQFIQLAQWMSGFAASLIAGTSILMPNFALQTADETQQEPQKKQQKIVRRIETNGKLDEELSELLKKYNIEMQDSAGIQKYSFRDDSSSADIIIIGQDAPDFTARDFPMSDSLLRLYMPRFDSATSRRAFSFKRFDKDFRQMWKPQMDSLRKGQKFVFKNFYKTWKPQADSLMKNEKFFYKHFENLDSAMQQFEFKMEGLDSALQNMEIEIDGIEPELNISVPHDSAFSSNVIVRTAPHGRSVAIVHGTPLKKDGKTKVFMLKKNCGDSLKICKERIIINGDLPAPPEAPAPPAVTFPAVPPVPPVPRVAIAPFPHMTKNTKVIIIRKKGAKDEKPEPEPQQTAEIKETTPIDRGRYIPGEYTEANPWNLNLSPNPTNGVVNISCEMPSKDIPVNVGVYDLQGNQVFLKEGIAPVEFQNMQLDLSGNATGTYLLQISQGERSFTTKFEINK